MAGKLVKCKTCGEEIARNVKVCPHCGARNPTVKTSSLVAAVVFIALFSIFVLKLAGSVPSESSNQNAQKPELTVSSISLWSAYTDNKISADNTYKGKWIAVNGTISDITQDVISKNPCVAINTGDGLNLHPVECFFSGEDEADNDILASLSDGQEITIVGKCEGTPILNVQLSNCHF